MKSPVEFFILCLFFYSMCLSPMVLGQEYTEAPEGEQASVQETSLAQGQPEALEGGQTSVQETALAQGQTEKQETKSKVTRPKYQHPLPQEQDWSVMRSIEKKDDFFDPIKYISLNQEETIWLSTGGQIRLRYEYWSDFIFTDANDDDYVSLRFLLHGDLHATRYFRFFVQGQSSHVTYRDLPGGRRFVDTDTLALLQCFGDFIVPLEDMGKFTLRAGRELMAFGNYRFFTHADWRNTHTWSWDGFRADWEWESFHVTGFWKQHAPVQQYDFNSADAQTTVFGIYATGDIPVKGVAKLGIDLYWLGRRLDDPGEDLQTFGGRVFGKSGKKTGVTYELEGAFQFGERQGSDIEAFMVALQLGYMFGEVTTSPKAWFGFDYATGDDDPNDDEIGTFDYLYGVGHKHFGWADHVGRRNLICVNLGVQCTPIEKMTAIATYHMFWRAEDTDGLYRARGVLYRGAGNDASNTIGSEIDLLVKYMFNPHLSSMIGYCHFFAGNFLEDTGASEDIDFLYVALQYDI